MCFCRIKNSYVAVQSYIACKLEIYTFIIKWPIISDVNWFLSEIRLFSTSQLKQRFFTYVNLGCTLKFDFYQIVIFSLIIQDASQPEEIWFVLKLLLIFSIYLFLDEGFTLSK